MTAQYKDIARAELNAEAGSGPDVTLAKTQSKTNSQVPKEESECQVSALARSMNIQGKLFTRLSCRYHSKLVNIAASRAKRSLPSFSPQGWRLPLRYLPDSAALDMRGCGTCQDVATDYLRWEHRRVDYTAKCILRNLR